MNPIIQSILKLAAGGGNPMSLIQQFLGGQNSQDPKIAQALRLIRGKSPEELERTARNLAKEAGTTPEQILESLGIPVPGRR